jgi:hypothetical protein
MRRQSRLIPLCVVGLGFGFASVVANAAAIQIVSQSVKANFADETLAFRIEFDQPPDLTTLGENGRPVQNFGYDIKSDATSGDLFDFDRAIRHQDAASTVVAFDRDIEGNLVNGRGPIDFTLNGNVVTFASTFQQINDTDGKFLYRVFATDHGELVSEAVGATIPLPAATSAAAATLLGVGCLRMIMPRRSRIC